MHILDVKLLIGLAIGLFLAGIQSYLIRQVYQNKSLIQLTQSCSSCGKSTGILGNLPIIGYFLGGRTCVSCGNQRDLIIPVLEFILVLVSAWAFYQLDPFRAIQITSVTMAVLGISYLDVRKWLIPNVFVSLIVFMAIIAIATGGVSLDHSLIGLGLAGVISFFMVLPHLLQKRAISEFPLGDVKLSLAVSLWLGWILAAYVFFFASILAFFTWIVLGLFRGYSYSRRLQFGPFVALSTLLFGIGRQVDPHFITHLLTFRF